MSSRGPARLRIFGRAALGTLRRRASKRPPGPRSILVLHELLLGDTLMLAPLLAALRARYPATRILVTAPPALVTLFSGRPYGVEPIAFSERAPDALERLAPAAGCDIAFIPGDSLHAVTARALGARWVVAFAGARPAWKDRFADELIAFPDSQRALGDIFASLAGMDVPPFRTGDWPAPISAPFDSPAGRYAVLHVGARSPLRYWVAERWQTLAERLAQQGFEPVWSAGPGEAGLVDEIDPARRYRSYAGNLDLAQLWRLFAGAGLAVTLDTGVAHLAKLTGTRTACLFGPGSAPLLGGGEFWREAPFVAVTVPEFPYRDQRFLFKRELQWVRHCSRPRTQCPRARCMEAIGVDDVLAALG